MRYVNDSVPVKVTVTQNGVPVTLGYSAGALLNLTTAGQGAVWFEVFGPDSNTTVALSNGVSLTRVYLYAQSLNGNVATGTVTYGFQAPGKYLFVPWYEIKDSLGNLSLRQQAPFTVEIQAQVATTGNIIP